MWQQIVVLAVGLVKAVMEEIFKDVELEQIKQEEIMAAIDAKVGAANQLEGKVEEILRQIPD